MFLDSIKFVTGINLLVGKFSVEAKFRPDEYRPNIAAGHEHIDSAAALAQPADVSRQMEAANKDAASLALPAPSVAGADITAAGQAKQPEAAQARGAAETPAAPTPTDEEAVRQEQFRKFNADLERYRQLRHPEQAATVERTQSRESTPTAAAASDAGDKPRVGQDMRDELEARREERDRQRLDEALGKMNSEQKAHYEARVRVAEDFGLNPGDRFRSDVATAIAKNMGDRETSNELKDIFRREELRQKEGPLRAETGPGDTVARERQPESGSLKPPSDRDPTQATGQVRPDNNQRPNPWASFVTDPRGAPLLRNAGSPRRFDDALKEHAASRGTVSESRERKEEAHLTRLNNESSRRNEAEQDASRGMRTEKVDGDDRARMRFDDAIKAHKASREATPPGGADGDGTRPTKGAGRPVFRSAGR